MEQVVGTLLEGPCRMPFYTDLRLVFDAFGGREREFDWLITGLECSRCPDALQPVAGDSGRLLPGAVLSAVVYEQDPPVQFHWAVLSGVPLDAHLDPPPSGSPPYADGNPQFWGPDLRMQLPGARVELVCWDSGATILLTTDADLTRRFRSFFPESVDLAAYNRRRENAG